MIKILVLPCKPNDTLGLRALRMALIGADFKPTFIQDPDDYFGYLEYDPDLVLIEDGSALFDARDLLRKTRLHKFTVPVIVTNCGDIVGTLADGADDAVRSYTPNEELFARMQCCVRRAAGSPSSLITCGPITFDLSTMEVTVDEVPVHLTGKERQVLQTLILAQGRTVRKSSLMNACYGGMDEPEPKIIDVFICKLRKKLAGASKGDRFIETVWGEGYSLRATDEADSDAA
jgi:two-component system, cell cycle response regulator CtrA